MGCSAVSLKGDIRSSSCTTSVVNTGGCTLTCKYLYEFSKKFETVLKGYLGAGDKLIHEKSRSKKTRDIVPLRQFSSWYLVNVRKSLSPAEAIALVL
jgi:hypothetical protein